MSTKNYTEKISTTRTPLKTESELTQMFVNGKQSELTQMFVNGKQSELTQMFVNGKQSELTQMFVNGKQRVNSLRCSGMVSSFTSETRRENVNEKHFFISVQYRTMMPSVSEPDTIPHY